MFDVPSVMDASVTDAQLVLLLYTRNTSGRVAVGRVLYGRRADAAVVVVDVPLTHDRVGWADEAGDPRVVDCAIGHVPLVALVATVPVEVRRVVKRPLLDVGQEQGLGAPRRPGCE